MNVYLDLMVVAHILLCLVSVFFVNRVSTNRFKKRGGFKLVTLTCPIIFCIYFRWWIAAIIILLVRVLIFVLFFKKHFLSPLLCYYFCYYGLAILMSLITEDASLYHFVFTLHAPRGMLILLVIPLFLVIQFFVIKAVDAIYHLKNYKMDAILMVEGKSAKFRCYFDTGNTLKYKGVPVIFCLKKNWPFPIKNTKETMTYEAMQEEGKITLEEALLSLKEKDEKTFVYVALVDRKEDFNGCECLLNAYLN